jgi:hypothetical protein
MNRPKHTHAKSKKVKHGKPVPMPLGLLVLLWMAEPKFKLRPPHKVLKKRYAGTRQALSR